MIGFSIIASGHIVSINRNQNKFKITSFLRGSEEDLILYTKTFDTLPFAYKFFVASISGVGGVLEDSPNLEFIENSNSIIIALNTEQSFKKLSPPKSIDDYAVHDTDMQIEKGQIKILKGIEAVTQSISTSLGVLLGERFGDQWFGTLISVYYHSCSSNKKLLAELVKLEINRLNTVYRINAISNEKTFAFNFLKKCIDVSCIPTTLRDNRITIKLTVEFIDDQLWTGNVPVFIHSEKQIEQNRMENPDLLLIYQADFHIDSIDTTTP